MLCFQYSFIFPTSKQTHLPLNSDSVTLAVNSQQMKVENQGPAQNFAPLRTTFRD